MKQKFRRIITHEIFFVLFITLLMLSLHLAPLFILARHTPSDRVFSFVHNNIQDFYFYQALMQQGASGAWLTTDPFTLEPHKPSIIFAYFLWLGKVSKLIGLSFPFTYHLTRIVFGSLAALAGFLLMRIIRLPLRRLAFIFFLFAGPLLHEIPAEGGTTQVSYMYWWTGIDAIRRFAYLPHHMFGSLLLILNVIAIIRYIGSKHPKWLLSAVLCALLLGFIHPPSLFIILIALPIATFIYFIQLIFSRGDASEGFPNEAPHKSDVIIPPPKKINNRANALERSLGYASGRTPKFLLGLLVYWFIGLFLMFIMVSQTNKGFPWSQYLSWEKNLQFPLVKELPGALGILLPIAVIGGFVAIKSGQFASIFVTCWLFAPFALIPLAPKLNISNIRLIQGTPYLPLSILAILGIQSIEKMLKRRWIIWLSFVIFLIFTIPTVSWSIKDQIHEYWNIWSNVYLSKRVFGAFDFINKQYGAKTNTLSTFYTGNYLAAYTHTNSFMGHFGYTFDREKKEEDADTFFKNNMSPDEVTKLLINNKITLIFQGVEEKPLYNGYLYPDLLKVVYDQDGITLYGLK